MKTVEFYHLLKNCGIDFFSGVPCTLLEGLIAMASLDSKVIYVPAVREDVAVAVASGAYLGGRYSCVFMQNSGLGNCLNVLASLNLIYKIPVCLVISWRGFKGKDAPEHLIMGRSTKKLLQDIRIPATVLSKKYLETQTLSLVEKMKKNNIPVALLLRKGILV